MMDLGMVEWDGRKHELNADETAVVLLEGELGRPLRRGEWYEKVCGEDDCVNPAHIQLVSKRGAKGDIVGADAARKTCDATADIAINLMLLSPDGEFAVPYGHAMPEAAEEVELEDAAFPCLQARCLLKVGGEDTPGADAEVTLLGTRERGLLRAVAYVPHLSGNRGDVFMRENLYRSFKRTVARRFGASPRKDRPMKGACELRRCHWMGDHVLGFHAVELSMCEHNLRVELCSTRFHTDVMGHRVQHHV